MEKVIDSATCEALARLYPYSVRHAAAVRLGYSRPALNAILRGDRRPRPEVAEVISAESRGRLTVARLCGWDPPTRHPGCRIFDDDPMPLARALGNEPYRDRASDRGAVRYLREVRADLPPAVAEAVEVVIAHLEVSKPDEETAR